MKNIFLLLGVITLGFMSCDGRKTSGESLKAAVTAFKKKNTSHKTDSYYPEAYTQTVTDTIMANKFRAKIKTYSLMTKNVIISQKPNNKTAYHRVFESEITVYTPSNKLLKTIINTEVFKTTNSSPFWNNATLEHVWVNQQNSTEHTISLDVSFINPQTKSFKLYNMVINSHGQQQINLIQEHS